LTSLDEILKGRWTVDRRAAYAAGFTPKDYPALQAHLIHYAKQRGIPVGPGRGSAAGSMVAYVLGITDLDPVRYGLIFERFLNPERVSPPDIDVDFCQARRGEVIEYVRQKYGERCVSQIVTFNQLGAKSVVRDVARVQLGTKKPTGVVRRFGARNIAIRVTRESGANVLEVMRRLREMTLRIDEQLKPKGLSLSLVYDETTYIDSAIGLVKDNILVGGLLTLGTLLLFLRNIRSTLIVRCRFR
jgi:hypothetical protein